MEKYILEKLRFSLKQYAKYKSNMKDKVNLLSTGKMFALGAEKELFLKGINEKEFYSFITRV